MPYWGESEGRGGAGPASLLLLGAGEAWRTGDLGPSAQSCPGTVLSSQHCDSEPGDRLLIRIPPGSVSCRKRPPSPGFGLCTNRRGSAQLALPGAPSHAARAQGTSVQRRRQAVWCGAFSPGSPTTLYGKEGLLMTQPLPLRRASACPSSPSFHPTPLLLCRRPWGHRGHRDGPSCISAIPGTRGVNTVQRVCVPMAGKPHEQGNVTQSPRAQSDTRRAASAQDPGLSVQPPARRPCPAETPGGD